jgi:hypothetical protein
MMALASRKKAGKGLDVPQKVGYFSWHKRATIMDALRRKIIDRIKAKGRGYAFTRKDFQGLAPTGSVGKALFRLLAEGMIRRLGRGLFDYPGVSKALGGELSPDIDQVAQAIARKFRWTIMPEGALAANQLGLSQQVPAKIVYLSDGPPKKVQAGNITIRFKHARPKEMRAENYASGLVIQALRYLGKGNVDRKVIDLLRRRLPAKEKANLLRDARYGTDWILQVAQQVAEG